MNGLSSPLMTQSEICNESPPWCVEILRDLESRLAGDSGFPCVFSKNAFKKKLIRFIFVANAESGGVQHLAGGLSQYVRLSREWDGSLDTAYPLVVGFSRDAVAADTAEGYDAFGWRILQALHDLDPAPWPSQVGQDANAADWSMCFNGMPLFVNMSHPLHQARRSRHLGRHFLFVINPRERFDVFAGDTPGGRQVRTNIRQRIERYDGQPHAPQLGFFGADSREWWQYSLLDHNGPRADRCPFLVRTATTSTARAAASAPSHASNTTPTP